MALIEQHTHVQQQIALASQLQKYNENPQVIVVSKQRSLEDISKLYALGYRHFGENRVDELLMKQAQLPNDIVWHFIGTLQTRKVKQVIHAMHYFHALDRYSVIDEIEKRATTAVNCFLQINLFEETQKHGFSVEAIDEVLQYVAKLTYVNVVGFMVMAPYQASQQTICAGFERIKNKQLFYKQQRIKNCPCHYLSMGMSQDYVEAIRYGATHLRIGSAFFE